MQVSRRTALATGAAAITTAAITAPIALKAAGVRAALAGDEPIIVMWRQSRLWLEEGARYDRLAGEAADKADFLRLSDMCNEIDRKAFDLEHRIADLTPESPQGWAIQARLLEDWMAGGTRYDGRDLLITRRIGAYLEGLADAERLAGGLPS